MTGPVDPWQACLDWKATLPADYTLTEDADGAPISAEELAEAGETYWGEGHDPLGPDELWTLRHQIALDRRHGK